MTRLTADQTPLEFLTHIAEPVQICDTNGEVLGQFTPDPKRIEALYGRALKSIDWEELRRRSQSKDKGIPLQETLGLLKLLEQEIERRKNSGERAFTEEEAISYFRSLRKENVSAGR